jgi:hypothetical protein
MRVYSKTFVYLYELINVEKSQISSRYTGKAPATFYIPITDKSVYFIEKNGWIVTDDGEPLVVKQIKQTQELLVVTAYNGHKLLEQRITKNTLLTRTGSADDVAKYFIDQSIGDLPITTAAAQAGTSISDQSRLANLGNEVARVCDGSGLGERFTLTEGVGIEFDTYQGVDCSAGNAEGNPEVVFALKYKNIEDYEYTEDGTKEQTTVYVGGAGEGDDREIYVAGDDAEGVGRVEVFVDARGIAAGDTDKLAERAAQAIVEEIRTVSAKAVTNSNLVYGVDYFLGDITTIKVPVKTYALADGYYDPVDTIVSVNLQISEAVKTREGGSEDIDLIFGYFEPPKADVVQLKREVEQLQADNGGKAASNVWYPIVYIDGVSGWHGGLVAGYTATYWKSGKLVFVTLSGDIAKGDNGSAGALLVSLASLPFAPVISVLNGGASLLKGSSVKFGLPNLAAGYYISFSLFNAATVTLFNYSDLSATSSNNRFIMSMLYMTA